MRLLERQPGDADALFHLGAIHQAGGKLGQAAEAYRRALRLQPENAQLWVRLADVCLVPGDEKGLAEAERCYAQAVALAPQLAEAHFGLGVIHGVRRKHEPALRSSLKALQLKGDQPLIQAAVLTQMQHLCDWSRFEEFCKLRRNYGTRSPGPSVPDPFGLLSIPSTLSEQRACAAAYSRQIAARAVEESAREGYRPMRSARQPDSHSRLRVGYVSSDFHEHVTAHCMVEVFELHDHRRVETFAYSFGPDDGSAIRRRLERAFDHFVDLRQRSDCAAAAAIAADGLDVLIDLKGHTDGARSGVLALRPAPVQVSYLGFPATMGAEFIDYIVTDRFVLPEEHAPFYSEKPAYLPASYYPSDRGRPVPSAPARRDVGLPESGVVYCSFNQAYKINPQVFGVWMRLLQSVPGSVLWLLETNAWMAGNLRREAAARGVDPGRLVFAPKSSPEVYLARLRAADLFLDTWPYNAHTTASDALWVGLPVVTYSGDTLPSRVAGSQLRALGMDELIAGSPEGYEAMAFRLSADPDALSALRARIGERRLSSALFDTQRLVRDLEALYEEMRRIHAAGARPRAIGK